MILRLTYRATFRNPIGPLNPSGLKFPVAMAVEVFEARKGHWQAREKDTGKDRTLERVRASQSSQEAKNHIAACFTEQVKPWEAWGKDQNGRLRVIEPHEIEERDGKVWLKEPDRAKERKGA